MRSTSCQSGRYSSFSLTRFLDSFTTFALKLKNLVVRRFNVFFQLGKRIPAFTLILGRKNAVAVNVKNRQPPF
jgi:hypothetical protein